MPIIDMPLEELREYRGINPPRRFDEFWDRSIEEMKQVDPCLELIPGKFQVPFAECFDMYFTGVGIRVHAQYIRPRRSGPILPYYSFMDTQEMPGTGRAS